MGVSKKFLTFSKQAEYLQNEKNIVIVISSGQKNFYNRLVIFL